MESYPLLELDLDAPWNIVWKKILYVLPIHLESIEIPFWLPKPAMVRNGKRRNAAMSACGSRLRHGPSQEVQDFGGVAAGRSLGTQEPHQRHCGLS